MYPTLRPGQDILSFNWAYLGKQPRVGDIVVIKQDGKEMVKRIQIVDDRHIFVYGDNLNESTDSRDFGEVSINNIVGKVVYKTVIPANAGIQLNYSRSELDSRFRGNDKGGGGHDMIDCPQCESPVIGIYGRKDAICKNCGFKLSCCE